MCVSGKNGQRIGTFFDNRMLYRRRRSEGDVNGLKNNRDKREQPQQQKAPNTNGRGVGVGGDEKPKVGIIVSIWTVVNKSTKIYF